MKKCDECGAEFKPVTWSHRFCCYKCRRDWKQKYRDLNRVRIGGGAYQRKFEKKPCEHCGELDLRAIHRYHLDNLPGRDNLMFLCANCHQIFHIEHRKNPVEIKDKNELSSFLRDAGVEGLGRAL